MQGFGRRASDGNLPFSMLGASGRRHAPRSGETAGHVVPSAAAQLRARRSPPFPAGSCGRGGAGNMAAPQTVMLPDKLR